MKSRVKTKTCPECAGAGTVLEAGTFSRRVKCDVCLGDGKVPVKKREKLCEKCHQPMSKHRWLESRSPARHEFPVCPERNHGGARKGAGRKPTGRKPYLLRMRPATMLAIRRYAQKRKLAVPDYLDHLFEVEPDTDPRRLKI